MYIKDYKLGLVYDGENTSGVVDYGESRKVLVDNPVLETYVMEVYGKEYVFKFYAPAEEVKEKVDITSEVYEEVLSLSSAGQITDYTLGVWKELRTKWRIVKDLGSNRIWLEEVVNPLSSTEEVLPIGEYIMLKEYMMGYIQPNTFSLRDHEIPIGQEYDNPLSSPLREHPLKKLDAMYSPALRYQMLHKALEEWNTNPRYRMHKRSTLLQSWQADALLRMARRTVLLLPRRSGKTLFTTLELMKELLAVNYKISTRPRTVLFITKDYDAVQQVMDYITSLLNSFDWMKELIRYDKVNHILYVYRSLEDRKENKPYSQCKFYSALGNLPGVGDAADAVFFDEAMYIPTYIKDNLMKIVTNEGARLLVVSTFYDEDPLKQTPVYYRPVDLCNKFEKESSRYVDIFSHIEDLAWKHLPSEDPATHYPPEEVAGLRYTIDDVEVIVNKDIAKDELQDNPESYMRQLYCRFLEKDTVFNYKPHILAPMDASLLGDRFRPQRILCAYDPAQTSDMSAFLVSGYDPKENKVFVFQEHVLNLKDKSSFVPQAETILRIKKELELNYRVPILSAMDSTHQAVVDAMASNKAHFQYLYYWVGGERITKGNRASERRVPKKFMVEATQHMFDNGMIQIHPNLSNLIDQLSGFIELKNYYTNKSKFENDSNSRHDDFVACLMMLAWTYWEHMNLKRNAFNPPDLPKDPTLDPRLPRKPVLQPRIESLDMGFYY